MHSLTLLFAQNTAFADFLARVENDAIEALGKRESSLLETELMCAFTDWAVRGLQLLLILKWSLNIPCAKFLNEFLSCSYLNLAEIRLLQNRYEASVAYWT